VLAFAQILKCAVFSTLAAFTFSPWISDLHTVMLGLALFWITLRRIS